MGEGVEPRAVPLVQVFLLEAHSTKNRVWEVGNVVQVEEERWICDDFAAVCLAEVPEEEYLMVVAVDLIQVEKAVGVRQVVEVVVTLVARQDGRIKEIAVGTSWKEETVVCTNGQMVVCKDENSDPCDLRPFDSMVRVHGHGRGHDCGGPDCDTCPCPCLCNGPEISPESESETCSSERAQSL